MSMLHLIRGGPGHDGGTGAGRIRSGRRASARWAAVAALALGASLASASVTCPPDFNNDGKLNIMDFVAFQNAFASGDLAADFSGDGMLDIRDFTAFQNAFALGCPMVPTELAGEKLAEKPFFQFVQLFVEGTDIFVAIDPVVSPEVIGKKGDVYVTAKKTKAQWDADGTLTDVRGAAETQTFAGPDIRNSTFKLADPAKKISFPAANKDLTLGFDVVVDFDQNGKLSRGDFIDGYGDEPGFRIIRDTAKKGPLDTVSTGALKVPVCVAPVLVVPAGFEDYICVYPKDIATMTKRPLVVISHGNGHKFDMYDYLQQHLASYGYVVYSHANNTMPGVDSAAETTAKHVDCFLEAIKTEAALKDLKGKVDETRITLIGHSRGAEGVVRAMNRVDDGTYVPQNYAVGGIRLISSIAPVSFDVESPFVLNPGTGKFEPAPTPNPTQPGTKPYHLLYGSSDGDVDGGPWDIRPAFPMHPAVTPELLAKTAWSFVLSERAEGPRAVTYLHGTCHNDFLNAGFGFDDFQGLNETRIGAGGAATFAKAKAEAQAVTKSIYVPLIRKYVEGDDSGTDLLARPFMKFRSPTIRADTVGDNEFRGPAARTVIDDFQTSKGSSGAAEDPKFSSSGGAVASTVKDLTEGRMVETDGKFDWAAADPFNGMTRAKLAADQPRAVAFEWPKGANADYEQGIVAALTDFSKFSTLSMRASRTTRHPFTIALTPIPPAQADPLTFTVTLDDGAVQASLNIGSYGAGLLVPYQRVKINGGPGAEPALPAALPMDSRGWADEFQTIRLPLADFKRVEPKLDLTKIKKVTLQFGSAPKAFGTEQGRIVLDDIELTKD